MFRGSIGAFLFGFVMLVAALVSFGRSAPTAVGALFLVAMVACGVIGFVLAARTSGQIKAASRAAQRPAPPGEPWRD